MVSGKYNIVISTIKTAELSIFIPTIGIIIILSNLLRKSLSIFYSILTFFFIVTKTKISSNY